jgi:hypothetical protein
MVNKKGWLKIAEAFMAILLIIVVVLMILEREEIEDDDFSKEIYEVELNILEGVKLNDTFRNEILTVSNSQIPVEWTNFDIHLNLVKEKINSEIPYYLQCEAKLCKLNSSCLFNNSIEKDVYSKSTVIFSDLNVYAPRKLKLFCWEK